MITSAAPSDTEIRREFRRLLRELASRLRYRFFGRGPDVQAERVAEGVAMAWSTFRSARRRGKAVTAGNLAYYIVKAVSSGRRLAGSSTTDALSDRAQRLLGKAVSLDADSDVYDLIISRRWRWPLVDIGGTRMDGDAFVARCRERDRRILQMRAESRSQREIAARLGISPPAVTQRLSRLRQAWAVYTQAPA